MEKKKTNGGKTARMGKKFLNEIEAIKVARLTNGKSKEMVSTEKISNLIVNHKAWKTIKDHIIEATDEEVEEHGLE